MSRGANFNMVESYTKDFWRVSRAWRGYNEEHKGHSFDSLITVVSPLADKPGALGTQAKSLCELMVMNKVRRKGKRRNNVVALNFAAKPVFDQTVAA